MEIDLFGNEIIKNPLLRDTFIEPPFSVLDTKGGSWQKRKKMWKSLGIESEVGRGKATTMYKYDKYKKKSGCASANRQTSIFDPALCEVLYKWFCPDNGDILDPFAGGSVRGIVANYLGYYYTGIDIRAEQIEANREQSRDILPADNQANYFIGDSNEVLSGEWLKEFDFVFSCPPYADLEVYSDLEKDISNMNYDDFMIAYRSIIKKSCALLKKGCYACFVVGEVRGKDGNYRGFIPDTIKAFKDAGMQYYNECILYASLAAAGIRAAHHMEHKKLVKVHQNILVFKK